MIVECAPQTRNKMTKSLTLSGTNKTQSISFVYILYPLPSSPFSYCAFVCFKISILCSNILEKEKEIEREDTYSNKKVYNNSSIFARVYFCRCVFFILISERTKKKKRKNTKMYSKKYCFTANILLENSRKYLLLLNPREPLIFYTRIRSTYVSGSYFTHVHIFMQESRCAFGALNIRRRIRETIDRQCVEFLLRGP